MVQVPYIIQLSIIVSEQAPRTSVTLCRLQLKKVRVFTKKGGNNVNTNSLGKEILSKDRHFDIERSKIKKQY